MLLLFGKLGLVLLIEFSGNAANEGLIVTDADEVITTAQIECLGDAVLEMTMR